MRIGRKRSSVIFFLGALAACGEANYVEQEQQNRAPSYVIDASLRKKIETAKIEALADKCFVEQPDVSVCEWADFSYEPSQFAMRNSTKEAVLIIDEFATLPPRAIRYKNRIKGFFHASTAGLIEPVAFSWHAPTHLFSILSSFATADTIPAQALRSLQEPLDLVYGAYGSENIGHGSYVFSLLVEMNPLQPLIILDRPDFHHFALTEFCDRSGSPQSISSLHAKSEQVADELRRLMRELDVGFVNLSAGVTLASLRSEWTSSCASSVPADDVMRAKLLAYAPIMAALFNTPGVFTAHAAIDAGDAQNFPFDFPSPTYPNRMRVGFITALESGLDSRGRGEHPALSGWPRENNVDIYLNSGVLPERPFANNLTPLLQIDNFGVSVYPISSTTTSWITPLALSRFINVRYAQESLGALTNELIAKMQQTMTPALCTDMPNQRCIFQDPLKHGQVEAVRLGYMPVEYATY